MNHILFKTRRNFMKNILLPIGLFALLAGCVPLYGNVTRLEAKQVQEIKGALKEFHKPTSSGYSSARPSMGLIESLKTDGPVLLVAKMDSFGLDRYFGFEDAQDIDQLVQAVQGGGGMDVSWYYLEKPYLYDSLIKITSFKLPA